MALTLLKSFKNQTVKRRISQRLYQRLKLEFSEEFGGLTAYSHSPAEGLCKRKRSAQRKDVVVYEVMSNVLMPGAGPNTERRWSGGSASPWWSFARSKLR
jgi:hypothetical protein